MSGEQEVPPPQAPGAATPPPIHVVETIPQLEWLAARLAGEGRVAVDMESDGFYAYHDKVCLLQLSAASEDYVVDPLKVLDLSPLAPLFRDPNVEKVFHAAEYDVSCLKRDFGFSVVRIFDTMLAARSLGRSKLGLAPLIEEHFGVHLSKKLQRANWGKRPLSLEQLEYARMDTHYLLRLRDLLEKDLEAKGHLAEIRSAFRRLERLEPAERVFNPDAFWNLHGARALSPTGKAVLKELYFYREKRSAELDSAPFRVLPEALLVTLAEHLPGTLEELEQVPGMTPYLFKRFGQDLVSAVHEGLSKPPIDKPPHVPRGGRDPLATRRHEALRDWRKRTAERRGVNPAVILDAEELQALVNASQGGAEPLRWLECLDPYKRDAYGEEILALLEQPPGPSGGGGGGGGGGGRRRRRR